MEIELLQLKCPSGNRALATGSCAVCRLHLPKVLRYYLQILNISQWKSSFCYSLVHILSTSSSKSAPNPTVFQHFHVEVELCPVRILSTRWPHLPKVLRNRQFFTIFIWNWVFARVLCAFCRPLSPIEPRNRGNRYPPSSDRGSHFTRKNTGFRAGECFQVWMHAFPISHTYFYDDVVAMMIDHHGEKGSR